jgi:hypothetical protein
LKHIHKPEISCITYNRALEEHTHLLQCLDKLISVTFADIENDPYMKSLRMNEDPKSQGQYEKVFVSGKTFTRTNLISLAQRARVIQSEVGPWAADVFVATCAERFIEGVL